MARRPQTLAIGLSFASILVVSLAFSLAFGGGTLETTWAALDPGHYDDPCLTATAGPTPILADAHAPAPVAPECERMEDDGGAADPTSTEAADLVPYQPTHVRYDHQGYGFAP